MITRLEIDGFKSFRNFVVNLRPFQVLIGGNGVGKSNLFDAIKLLSDLATAERLEKAFQANRGDVRELFSQENDGNYVDTMRFAVEMLIDQNLTGEPSTQEQFFTNHLRYELGIARVPSGNLERLTVIEEKLYSSFENHTVEYIALEELEQVSGVAYLDKKKVYQLLGGRDINSSQPIIDQTLLSRVHQEFTTAYAVNQEMRRWRQLHLHPFAMRQEVSSYTDADYLEADGSNLAAVLYRMAQEDEFALTDVSRELLGLTSTLLGVNVELLPQIERLLIQAETTEHTKVSSRLLSDGSLRLLALLALKNDARHRGVICLEEPENGITPSELQQLTQLLYALATDFQQPPDTAHGQHFKQVLINTHSPKLLSFVKPEDVLFVTMPRSQVRKTRMFPLDPKVMPEDIDKAVSYFTLDQVIRYLGVESQQEAQDILRDFRTSL